MLPTILRNYRFHCFSPLFSLPCIKILFSIFFHFCVPSCCSIIYVLQPYYSTTTTNCRIISTAWLVHPCKIKTRLFMNKLLTTEDFSIYRSPSTCNYLHSPFFNSSPYRGFSIINNLNTTILNFNIITGKHICNQCRAFWYRSSSPHTSYSF